MRALWGIALSALRVYAVTLAVFLALWSGIWLVRRPPDTGAEYAAPIPAELVKQIEGHLRGGGR